jgi:hypothetical protein
VRVDITIPIKAGQRLYEGAIVAVDDIGGIPIDSSLPNLRIAGVCVRGNVDADGNTLADATEAVIRKFGVYSFKMPGATAADLLTLAYAIDDEVVSGTPGDNAYIVGKIVDIFGGFVAVDLNDRVQ